MRQQQKRLLWGLLGVAVIAICLWILMPLVITPLLSRFGGAGDWEYTDLPEDYAVVRTNDQSVVFGKQRDSFERTIDRYVWAFCYNDSYIALQHILMHDIPEDDIINIEKLSETRIEFYLIQVDTGSQYGPFSQGEYEENAGNLGFRGCVIGSRPIRSQCEEEKRLNGRMVVHGGV